MGTSIQEPSLDGGTRTRAAAPFCALERLECGESGDYVTLRAEKTVDPADPYLIDHFPGFTIFPGVFIIEAVNQAVVAGVREARGLALVLDTVVSVRFLVPLLAGDRLTAEITVGPLTASDAPTATAVCRRGDGVVCARPKLRFRRTA